MKNFGIKLKLILLPYFLLSIIFIGLYTFLDWIFIMRTGAIFSMNEFISYALIPFILLWVPLWIWVKPKTKLLIYSKDNGWFTILIIMSLAIGFTNAITQFYVEAYTGKVTSLNTIEDMNGKPLTRYYTLKNHYVDTASVGIYNTSSISGKGNRNYDMSVIIVLPILKYKNDTITKGKYWIGKEYTSQINNTQLSDEGRSRAFDTFFNQSQIEFHKTNFDDFIYLTRIGASDELTDFSNDILKNQLSTTKDITILKASNQPFALRTGDKFIFIWVPYGTGLLFMLFFLIFTKINKEAYRDFQDRQSRARWKHGS